MAKFNEDLYIKVYTAPRQDKRGDLTMKTNILRGRRADPVLYSLDRDSCSP